MTTIYDKIIVIIMHFHKDKEAISQATIKVNQNEADTLKILSLKFVMQVIQ